MKVINAPATPDETAHLDASGTTYPSELILRRGPCSMELREPESMIYGYVVEGAVALTYAGQPMALGKEFYFAVPGAADVELGPLTLVCLMRRAGFRGSFMVGKHEDVMSAYASDRLLVDPGRGTGPALRLVRLPAGVGQVQHMHSLLRLGCVVAGRGEVVGPKAGAIASPTRWWAEALGSGSAFLLDEREVHGFRAASDVGMDLVVYQPGIDHGREYPTLKYPPKEDP